jgi:hypothetical protein
MLRGNGTLKNIRALSARVLLFAASAGALGVIGVEMLLVTISPTEYVMWREIPVVAALETVMLLGLAGFQFKEALRKRR